MPDKEKHIEEMRYLADEMGKAISTEYEKRILADERKLEAVLKENGWRKASEFAREFFEEIERLLDNYHSACLPVGAIEAYTYYEGGLGDAIAEFKKKYESESGE